MTTYHSPKAGERISGRYELQSQIAEGGFASVWEARGDDGRRVAVKFMLPNKVDDPKVVERFHREARLVSQLVHDNIVAVEDYGVTEPLSDKYEGVPFLVMEYLVGETLESLVRKSKGPMTPHRAVSLLLPVLSGLAEAHRLGVIHRDLKPENVFVQADKDTERPKLIDFGICKRMDTSPFHTGGAALTATDQVFGTPEYMAPEQVAADPLSPATDVYAVGVMLYEMLTGRRPFTGPTPLKVMLKHLDDPMPPLPSPYRHMAIAQIIDRATRKEPDERFPDADAMRAALLDLPDNELVDQAIPMAWDENDPRLHTADTVDLRPPTAVVKKVPFSTVATDAVKTPASWWPIGLAVAIAVLVLGVAGWWLIWG